MVGQGLEYVNEMKGNVKDTGRMIEQDNILLDKINKRGDEVIRTADRNNNKMERYLEKTSNCQLYVLIAFELLFFLIFMSI